MNHASLGIGPLASYRNFAQSDCRSRDARNKCPQAIGKRFQGLALAGLLSMAGISNAYAGDPYWGIWPGLGGTGIVGVTVPAYHDLLSAASQGGAYRVVSCELHDQTQGYFFPAGCTIMYPSGDTEERQMVRGNCTGRLINNYCVDNISETPDVSKNIGKPRQCVGNPVNQANGNKFEMEVDYADGKNQLSFVRYFNSAEQTDSPQTKALGNKWRHHFDRSLAYDDYVAPNTVVWAVREDGRVVRFEKNAGEWLSDSDETDKLTAMLDTAGNLTGWKYQYGPNKTDTFDAAGKLVSIGESGGYTQTLSYSDASTPTTIAPAPGLLIKVMDSFNRQIELKYDSNMRIVSMTDPENNTYQYSYTSDPWDPTGARSSLASVSYPDGKARNYIYEDTSFPNLLTGIEDENGYRFATWNYDSMGRAILSEHANGAQRVSLNFTTQGTEVTDARGTMRSYGFQTVGGVMRTTSSSQPGGSGCNAASSSMAYDANGNISSQTNFNGVTTTYTYDLARNLETQRVEASGTSQARTITTEWHSTYRLPIRIAEPKLLTVNTYDTYGNLLSRSEQATTDANGSQGFGATATGSPRVRHYTYNQYGQVLTATGPRTDVSETTQYAYDTQGNLVSITNAAGKVTALSNYDASGRVGRITDPNGLVTDLTYSPRGWLTSKSVGGELTSYEYDGVGQLTKVTQPDGSYLSYTYDDAHRLTTIADNLNNRIAYTLDAMGNRVNEQVQDPNGMLARQTSRTYDALNRLQQITGAQQ